MAIEKTVMNKFASIAQSINPIVARVFFSLVMFLSSLNMSVAATDEWINLGSMGTGEDNYREPLIIEVKVTH